MRNADPRTLHYKLMIMAKEGKRRVEVVVISDLHLGTYGCRADALVAYLKSIKPGVLILNGDIIDIWQFKKHYFPADHMKVVKHILNMLVKGTQVYYITGNHDEMFRKFENFNLGSFKIVNQLTLSLDGKSTWFFHGDVFDLVMQNSKWLAKLGAVGYDGLILLNSWVNHLLKAVGRKPVRLSQRVKDNVKAALKYIDDFELTAANHGAKREVNAVVCGHIHKPQMRTIETGKGDVLYLNSGDWIENLTALEYNNKQWVLHHFDVSTLENSTDADEKPDEATDALIGMNSKDIFKLMTQEFYGN